MQTPFEFHFIEQLLLAFMIFFFMFAIGAGLQVSDFKRCLKIPKALSVALACQYLIMPWLALAFAKFFSLPLSAAVVLLIIGCSPGGTSSNMFSFLARADMGLSVTLTLISSLFAVIMTPLLMKIYAPQNLGHELILPYQNMIATLGASLIPIILGMLVKIKNPFFATKAEGLAHKIGLFIVMIMIAIWIPKLIAMLADQQLSFFLAPGLMSLGGMTIGLMVATVFKLPRPQSYAISFETGIQNAPLVFAMIALSFSPEHPVAQYAWIALVYGALSVGSALLVLSFTGLFSKA